MAFDKPAPRTPSVTGDLELHVITARQPDGSISVLMGEFHRTVLDTTGEVMDRQPAPLSIMTAAERTQLKALLDKYRTLSDQNLAT